MHALTQTLLSNDVEKFIAGFPALQIEEYEELRLEPVSENVTLAELIVIKARELPALKEWVQSLFDAVLSIDSNRKRSFEGLDHDVISVMMQSGCLCDLAKDKSYDYAHVLNWFGRDFLSDLHDDWLTIISAHGLSDFQQSLIVEWLRRGLNNTNSTMMEAAHEALVRILDNPKYTDESKGVARRLIPLLKTDQETHISTVLLHLCIFDYQWHTHGVVVEHLLNIISMQIEIESDPPRQNPIDIISLMDNLLLNDQQGAIICEFFIRERQKLLSLTDMSADVYNKKLLNILLRLPVNRQTKQLVKRFVLRDYNKLLYESENAPNYLQLVQVVAEICTEKLPQPQMLLLLALKFVEKDAYEDFAELVTILIDVLKHLKDNDVMIHIRDHAIERNGSIETPKKIINQVALSTLQRYSDTSKFIAINGDQHLLVLNHLIELRDRCADILEPDFNFSFLEKPASLYHAIVKRNRELAERLLALGAPVVKCTVQELLKQEDVDMLRIVLANRDTQDLFADCGNDQIRFIFFSALCGNNYQIKALLLAIPGIGFEYVFSNHEMYTRIRAVPGALDLTVLSRALVDLGNRQPDLNVDVFESALHRVFSYVEYKFSQEGALLSPLNARRIFSTLWASLPEQTSIRCRITLMQRLLGVHTRLPEYFNILVSIFNEDLQAKALLPIVLGHVFKDAYNRALEEQLDERYKFIDLARHATNVMANIELDASALELCFNGYHNVMQVLALRDVESAKDAVMTCDSLREQMRTTRAALINLRQQAADIPLNVNGAFNRLITCVDSPQIKRRHLRSMLRWSHQIIDAASTAIERTKCYDTRRVLANILIGFTGVGLLLLAARAVYSKIKHGYTSAFFVQEDKVRLKQDIQRSKAQVETFADSLQDLHPDILRV